MYNKYKDELPKKTIERIKNIHKELNINYSLSVTSKIPGICSAVFKDEDAKWATCGKGTDQLFCCASAFGESIEHLCNYFAYDLTQLSDEVVKYGGFEKYPDEVIYPIEKIGELAPFVLDDLKEAYALSSGNIPNDHTIYKFLRDFFKKESFSFVPYYSIKQRKIVMLPEEILSSLCGSNGGGAGNTAVEAIGHGLDEIVERYSKYQIYTNHLTPPIIPHSYIEKEVPELATTIRLIEQSGMYRVIVKDASLGKGFPVICVLLIDYKNGKYLANFGSHPKFEIALERCLTEMFQYYELNSVDLSRKEMTKWVTVEESIVNSAKNWVSLLKDDVGFLPDTLFSGEPSWKFKSWEKNENYTNSKGVQIQISNLLSIADDVFIRDNSYLGFPVYKAYIPKISSNHLPIGDKHLKCIELCKDMYKTINTSEWLSECDLKQYLDYVFNPEMFISSVVLHNMDESFFYALNAALLCDLGEIHKAKELLKCLEGKQYDCTSKVLELREKNVDIKTINELITLFYASDIAEFALNWCREQVFLTLMKKYVIGKYKINSTGMLNDYSENIDALHLRLKEKMLTSDIKQTDIAEIV